MRRRGTDTRATEAHPVPAQPVVVLFDGECGLCDRSVRFLARHDRDHRLAFAPVGSTAAARLVRDAGADPGTVESVAGPGTPGGSVVVLSRGHLLARSSAVLAAIAVLPFPWRLGAALRVIPAPIRDAAYRFVARHRHRVFGPVDSCALPRR